MRADSIQDLSYGHNSSFGKGFAFESNFRHRSGSDDITKELFAAKENSILPNKPNAAFNLGGYSSPSSNPRSNSSFTLNGRILVAKQTKIQLGLSLFAQGLTRCRK